MSDALNAPGPRVPWDAEPTKGVPLAVISEIVAKIMASSQPPFMLIRPVPDPSNPTPKD